MNSPEIDEVVLKLRRYERNSWYISALDEWKPTKFNVRSKKILRTVFWCSAYCVKNIAASVNKPIIVIFNYAVLMKKNVLLKITTISVIHKDQYDCYWLLRTYFWVAVYDVELARYRQQKIF